MIKRLVALAMTTAVAVGIALSGQTNSASAEPFKLDGDAKIAWIFFSEVNDGGWTQALQESRVRMEADLGMKITWVEKIPEVTSQVTNAADRLISRGHNIIIGGAFGHSDAFKALSEKYPDVAFLNPAGTTNGDNLNGFYGRTYESQYLCGLAAGGLTKTNKIGFVAANPFGLVNWTVNAYLLGARQVNPDVTLHVVYTGAWNNPIKERAAAQALVEQGVDVIGQHVDTPTPQVVAQENGIHGTGHHRDMSEFADKATQCSSVWVWDRYLTPVVKSIIAGTWDPSTRPYGDFIAIKNGGTDIACCGDMVPADVVAKIQSERQAIIDGKHVFTGPIRDQAGTIRVKAGETLDDGSLWGMDYLVEGVVGQLN
jgi:basic membrane protein A